MSREHKVGWIGFIVILVALACYVMTAACTGSGRLASPDVALMRDSGSTDVTSSGAVSIDKRTASPDLSAAAPQTTGQSEMQADNGGIAERTDQQQQGLVNLQVAGMGTAALVLWLLHGYKTEKLNEKEQTERMRIMGKSNEQLLRTVHKCDVPSDPPAEEN